MPQPIPTYRPLGGTLLMRGVKLVLLVGFGIGVFRMVVLRSGSAIEGRVTLACFILLAAISLIEQRRYWKTVSTIRGVQGRSDAEN